MTTRILPVLAIAVLPTACGTIGAPPNPAQEVAASLRMVAIPAGDYSMGDVTHDGETDELPVHAVHVPAFRLAAYEVTVGQFRRFVEATGYQTDAERNAEDRVGCVQLDAGNQARPDYRPGVSWRNPGFPHDDQHPVVCLSYADVQAFVAWVAEGTGRHFRLPAEAEWEYAARAGTATTYPWGSEEADACQYANGGDTTPSPAGGHWTRQLPCSDGWYGTAPVGHYRPNAWGLYDMIGNAWEWMADCYHDDYFAVPTDGSAVTSGDCRKRVVRGGAWPYPAEWLRSANRGAGNPQLRANDRGFRLAESP